MPAEPLLRYVLFYEYVDDMLTRRGPYRDAHLALIRRWREQGRVEQAGALGAPPHGAAIVFAVGDPSDINEFFAADPYVAAGLVRERRVEPWRLV